MQRLGLLRGNDSVTLLKSLSDQFANEIDGISLKFLATQSHYLLCRYDVLEKPQNSTCISKHPFERLNKMGWK